MLNSAVVALPSDRETAKIKGDALYCRMYLVTPESCLRMHPLLLGMLPHSA